MCKSTVLTIKRSEWRRGIPEQNPSVHGDSCLLNSKGLKCCLGFDALHQGFTKAEIRDVGTPRMLAQRQHLDPDHPYCKGRAIAYAGEVCYYSNSEAVRDAVDANDEISIPQQDKETKIREIFIKHFGYTDVVFVD